MPATATQAAPHQIEAGLDYINVGDNKTIVHVTKVEGSSVRFHNVGDDYMFVESLHYFRNDFRQYQEG
jgi:ribosomal protein S11